MANFFTRLTKWQNYVHYLLLTGIVSWVAYGLGAPFDFNMFLQLFATLLIGDTLIHGLFWILPKPLRWRD